MKRKDAFELLFTGDIISAERASELGLVNRVVPPEQLDAAIGSLAQSIVGKSQAAVAAGKRVFYRQLELGLDAAYELAGAAMARNMMIPKYQKAKKALTAKSK